MNDLKDIGNKYGGAIIGFLVGLALAIILFCTDLYKVITGILLVIACVYFGNYIQKNFCLYGISSNCILFISGYS